MKYCSIERSYWKDFIFSLLKKKKIKYKERKDVIFPVAGGDICKQIDKIDILFWVCKFPSSTSYEIESHLCDDLEQMV